MMKDAMIRFLMLCMIVRWYKMLSIERRTAARSSLPGEGALSRQYQSLTLLTRSREEMHLCLEDFAPLRDAKS
jgi:hypothetical protein